MWGKRGGCYADLVWVWWGRRIPEEVICDYRGEYIWLCNLKWCRGYSIVTLKFEYFVGLACFLLLQHHVGIQNGNVNTSLSTVSVCYFTESTKQIIQNKEILQSNLFNLIYKYIRYCGEPHIAKSVGSPHPIMGCLSTLPSLVNMRTLSIL